MKKSVITKILVGACSMALVAAVSIGATVAYLTSQDNADNVFTIGNVTIDLQEPGWDANLGASSALDIEPGMSTEKDPQVKNVGKNDAYIRVKVSIPQLKGEDLFQYSVNGTDFGKEYYNTTDWVMEETAEPGVYYFYYNKILAPTQTTGKIFNHVKLDAALAIEDTIEETNIEVYAEAVQTKGIDVGGKTGAEAAKAAFVAAGL